MSERVVVDKVEKTVQTVGKALETLIKKAWSIMDAASEKQVPSQYLGERAVRSIQGKGQ